MTPVIAAGGVIHRTQNNRHEVLLIYRNGVWDLPKGKKEPGETIEACAQREVSEEVGIPLPELEQFLTETYHEYERDGTQFGKTTHWFSMRSTQQEHFTPERVEGIEAVEWEELKEAQTKVGFENLENVLQALELQLNH